MITTKRDNKGVKVLIKGFGQVTLYSDIVDYEYHRKRISTQFQEFVSDYYLDNVKALEDVFKKFADKHPSVKLNGHQAV